MKIFSRNEESIVVCGSFGIKILSLQNGISSLFLLSFYFQSSTTTTTTTKKKRLISFLDILEEIGGDFLRCEVNQKYVIALHSDYRSVGIFNETLNSISNITVNNHSKIHDVAIHPEHRIFWTAGLQFLFSQLYPLK